MKNLKKLIAFAATLLALSFSVMSVSAEDYTYNTLDWGSGWTADIRNDTTLGNGNIAEISDLQAHSGDSSLRLAFHEGDWQGLRTPNIHIKHDAGSTREFNVGWDSAVKGMVVNFYVKATDESFWNSGAKNVVLGVFDDSGNTVRSLNDTGITYSEPDENGWRKAEFIFCYPYGMTSGSDTNETNIKTEANRHFRVIVTGGFPGEVYIDDVSIEYYGMVSGEMVRYFGYIFNDGFEKWIDTGVTFPVENKEKTFNKYGWRIMSEDTTVTKDVKIVEFTDGNKALYVKAPESWTSSAVKLEKLLPTDRMRLTHNCNYKLRFKWRGSVNAYRMYVGSPVASGATQYTHLYNKADVSHTLLDNGWIQTELTLVGPLNLNATPYNRVMFDFRGFNKGVYIDDVEVITFDAEGYENYADETWNGTFDNELEASAVQPSGWIVRYAEDENNPDDTFVATKSTKYAYTGKTSIFMSAPGSLISGSYRNVNISQNLPADFDYTKDYTLKLKMKTLNPNTNVYARYRVPGGKIGIFDGYNENTYYINSTDCTMRNLGDDWYEYTIPVAGLAENLVDGQFAIFADSYVGGVWIDDVSLTDDNNVNYITNGSFEKYSKCEVVTEPYLTDGFLDIDAPVEGENWLTTVVNNLEAGLDYDLYLAIYKNGNLFKVVKASYEDVAAGNKTLEVMIELDAFEENDVYTAKSFIWNPELVPYCEASEFVAPAETDN